jgi:hypothetical protein
MWEFYSASSLKQQSAGRRGFILLLCCMPSGEATNTNFLVFSLTCTRLEHTVDRGFIDGVMVGVFDSNSVDRGFIDGVMVGVFDSQIPTF